MALILDITTDLRYIQGREETLAEQKELFEKIQKEKETAQKEITLEKFEKAQEEKQENIKKAYTKGMNVLDIADIFGVSVAFVKKIVK